MRLFKKMLYLLNLCLCIFGIGILFILFTEKEFSTKDALVCFIIWLYLVANMAALDEYCD